MSKEIDRDEILRRWITGELAPEAFERACRADPELRVRSREFGDLDELLLAARDEEETVLAESRAESFPLGEDRAREFLAGARSSSLPHLARRRFVAAAAALILTALGAWLWVGRGESPPPLLGIEIVEGLEATWTSEELTFKWSPVDPGRPLPPLKVRILDERGAELTVSRPLRGSTSWTVNLEEWQAWSADVLKGELFVPGEPGSLDSVSVRRSR